MIVYGPISSRRLGQSIGINNVPDNKNPYYNIYSKKGIVCNYSINREAFFQPKVIFIEASDKILSAKRNQQQVEYLTFSATGEPSLDENLVESIRILRPLKARIAVFSNGALLWQDDVFEAFLDAHVISIDLDTIDENIWQKINRPDSDLDLQRILKAIKDFSDIYRGKLFIKTTLLRNINDNEEQIIKLANFISTLNPEAAYLTIPPKECVENWVEASTVEKMNECFQVFDNKKIKKVEFLIEQQGNAYSHTGNVKTDLMRMMAVYPMRAQTVQIILERYGADWRTIEELLTEQNLVKTTCKDVDYYLYNFLR